MKFSLVPSLPFEVFSYLWKKTYFPFFKNAGFLVKNLLKTYLKLNIYPENNNKKKITVLVFKVFLFLFFWSKNDRSFRQKKDKFSKFLMRNNCLH